MQSLFNAQSIAAFVLAAGLIVFIILTAAKQKGIKNWGRRIAILVFWGLAVCILAAVRDGYHLSVQAFADPGVLPGLFPVGSIQSTACCILGGILGIGSLIAAFARKQEFRRAVFFILCGAAVIKTLIIEISKLFL
jgi:hypothetical protein